MQFFFAGKSGSAGLTEHEQKICVCFSCPFVVPAATPSLFFAVLLSASILAHFHSKRTSPLSLPLFCCSQQACYIFCTTLTRLSFLSLLSLLPSHPSHTQKQHSLTAHSHCCCTPTHSSHHFPIPKPHAHNPQWSSLLLLPSPRRTTRSRPLPPRSRRRPPRPPSLRRVTIIQHSSSYPHHPYCSCRSSSSIHLSLSLFPLHPSIPRTCLSFVPPKGHRHQVTQKKGQKKNMILLPTPVPSPSIPSHTPLFLHPFCPIGQILAIFTYIPYIQATKMQAHPGSGRGEGTMGRKVEILKWRMDVRQNNSLEHALIIFD